MSEAKLVKITLPSFSFLTAADLTQKEDFEQLFNFQGPVISECTIVSRSINMLSVTVFVPKGIISGVRVQAGLYLDMLDADRSPNAVSVYAGTSQVDFEVDCPPPARSTRSLDHHGKGNGNFV